MTKHTGQTVVYKLDKDNGSTFRRQEVTELHKEDGVKFGLWQDDKIVAAWGSTSEWHFFGHRSE